MSTAGVVPDWMYEQLAASYVFDEQTRSFLRESNPWALRGITERVIAARDLEEVSIGDYVLSGGEIAAMALLDACVRLLPGVMGAPHSAAEESFAAGLLEYPQYTRPQVWEGRPIPEILISGDHAKVAGWRRAEAERLTRERRPDLWAAFLQRFRGGLRDGG